MIISRKDFLRLSVMALGGASVAAALPGCGAPASGVDAGSSTCAANGAHDTAIVGNHGHSLLVPAADFTASGDKTYDIAGTAGHSHTVTLTEANRTTLKAGTPVTTTSTVTLSHSHDVTVACA